LEVSTYTIALDLILWAFEHTETLLTVFPGQAGFLAGAAVVWVREEIATGAFTDVKTRWAGERALSVEAKSSRTTVFITATTVKGVRFDVDALVCAKDLRCGAVERANTLLTSVPRCAGKPTGAAIFLIAIEIETILFAGGERLWTLHDALRVHTKLRLRARAVTCPAVFGITDQVDAGRVAHALIRGAKELARAFAALKTVGTCVVTGSTVLFAQEQINTTVTTRLRAHETRQLSLNIVLTAARERAHEEDRGDESCTKVGEETGHDQRVFQKRRSCLVR